MEESIKNKLKRKPRLMRKKKRNGHRILAYSSKDQLKRVDCAVTRFFFIKTTLLQIFLKLIRKLTVAVLE